MRRPIGGLAFVATSEAHRPLCPLSQLPSETSVDAHANCKSLNLSYIHLDIEICLYKYEQHASSLTKQIKVVLDKIPI